MELQQVFDNVTRNMHFHAPANPGSARSLFLLKRYMHPLETPHPVVDAQAVELHPPKRVQRHHRVHLSRAMHEALLSGEKVVGVGSFHIMYLFYTGIFSGLLFIFSVPLGIQLQASAREIAAYLAAVHAGDNFELVQFAQVMAALGYHHIAQFLLAIDGGWFDWLFGKIDYDTTYSFFASHRWFTIPAGLLRLGAALLLAYRLLRLCTTEIVVTDGRLLYKHGIFIVRTLKTRLEKLDRVDVNQTWLGNLLGYGSIHIFTHDWETLGTGHDSAISPKGIFLPAIAHPQHLSSLIDRCRGELRHAGSAPAAAA